MQQKSGMCIGGPWDGKLWPMEGKGSPAAPIRKESSFDWTPNREVPAAEIAVCRYRREHLTHRPSGTAASFFVAEGLSIEDAAKIADERFPRGAPNPP
ncbi:MAG: hypothetical protein EOS04_24090 [Mesorhizobium sp.]|nr:MAG: hypothetical protein EOR98_26425 [Mesorhizobium sp.]RWN73216.1 MAG: hypothetical protein EOS01_27130 [Mesorhizobium sp.]RWN85130.1 MAG: hypothetical protein EOS04_24090 [Mesorhizobium sp.]